MLVRVEPFVVRPTRALPRSPPCCLRITLDRHGELWTAGNVEHSYRTDRGRWRTVVSYSTGRGENRMGGFDQADVRPRGWV